MDKWGKIEGWYKECTDGIYPEPYCGGHVRGTKEVIKKFVCPRLSEIKTVLDIGCGEGVAFKFFKKLGILWVGVTLGTSDIKACRKKGLRVFEYDMHFIAFPDESVDLVYCVPGETRVLTSNGYSSIESIQLGTRVVNLEGDGSVTRVHSRLYNGPLVSCQTDYGKSLKLTPNHKVLCLPRELVFRPCGSRKTSNNGGRPLEMAPVWRKASDLREGDFLAIPLMEDIGLAPALDLLDYIEPAFEQRQVRELKSRGHSWTQIARQFGVSKGCVRGWHSGKIPRGKYAFNNVSVWGSLAKRIPRNLALSEGLMRLFGYFVAEGSTDLSGMGGRFDFTNTDKAYIQDIVDLAEENFGLEPEWSGNRGRTLRPRFSSIIVSSLFRELFGRIAPEKHFPSFFSTLPRKQQTAFLLGFWRGDGTGGTKRLAFTTTSEFLAKQIQDMLLRLGYPAGILVAKRPHGGGIIRGRHIRSVHPLHQVYLSGENAQGLISEWGIDKGSDAKLKIVDAGNRAYSFALKNSRYLFLKIRSVAEEQFQGNVYNLSVSGHPSYTANLFAVHNCRHIAEHSPMPYFFLKEAHRLARKYLLLVVPRVPFFCYNKDGPNHPNHPSAGVSREGWLYLAEMAGWELIAEDFKPSQIEERLFFRKVGTNYG